MVKGYLASVDIDKVTGLSLPLIFRFQFNPDLLSERKSYNYKQVDKFGSWAFDQTTKKDLKALERIAGFATDIKEIGSLLTKTRPLTPEEGEPRVFAIDFVLDGRLGEDPANLSDRPRYKPDGHNFTIEPDLATLRSFVNPVWGLVDLGKMVFKGVGGIPEKVKPPECTLIYGNINVTCVMADLNIKITAFNPDGTAQRAEVSVTLKEQTLAFSPISEFVKRQINVGKSYFREGIGEDFLKTTPIVNMFT